MYIQNFYNKIYKIMRIWFYVARMRGLNLDDAKQYEIDNRNEVAACMYICMYHKYGVSY